MPPKNWLADQVVRQGISPLGWSKTGRTIGLKMESALYYLATLATLSVFAVLCMGLYTLLGKSTASLSQKLMRWRVGLQFLAIVLIVGFVLAKG